jgi:hypothetical protein
VNAMDDLKLLESELELVKRKYEEEYKQIQSKIEEIERLKKEKEFKKYVGKIFCRVLYNEYYYILITGLKCGTLIYDKVSAYFSYLDINCSSQFEVRQNLKMDCLLDSDWKEISKEEYIKDMKLYLNKMQCLKMD